jgi:putative protein kinase ArgK-like GTPase of G3E family
VADLIEQHRQYLEQTGYLKNRERSRLEAELNNLLQETLVSRWQNSVTDLIFQNVLDTLVARKISPFQAVGILLNGGRK